jgi:hypothetical protein
MTKVRIVAAIAVVCNAHAHDPGYAQSDRHGRPDQVPGLVAPLIRVAELFGH